MSSFYIREPNGEHEKALNAYLDARQAREHGMTDASEEAFDALNKVEDECLKRLRDLCYKADTFMQEG